MKKTETMKFLEDIVVLATNIGAKIIICGGEIERAEDSARRICESYGLCDISVFAVNSVIIVTAMKHNRYFTHSIRITSSANSMSVLEDINDFSRKICVEKPDCTFALSQLFSICENASIPLKLLGEIITAVSFALFFNGKFSDILLAAFVSAILCIEKSALKDMNLRPYIAYAVLTFAAGILVMIAENFGLCENVQAVMLGCLMSMFPGLSLVNSSLSFMSSDTISAILQLIHSLLTAVSIAFGFAFSVAVAGMIK